MQEKASCERESEETGPAIEAVCEGNPREMGVTQGTALREKIRATRAALGRLDALQIEKPWFLPFPLFLRLSESRAAKVFAPALAKTNPAMLERIQGIAEGAGVRVSTIHLMNVLEPLLSSVSGRTVRPGLGACSAVAVRGRRSTDGYPVVARNFDFLPLVQPFYVLRTMRPRGGLRSLEFTVAPFAGAVDGVNERGLGITLNYAFATDRPAPSTTITMAISEALATCSSVEQAAARIAALPRWGAGIVMLADAGGDIASLELSNTRFDLRRPKGGEDVLVHTNCFTCATTREVEVARDAVFCGRVPAALHGVPVLALHEKRASRIENLLGERDRIDPDFLAEVMADHGPSSGPDGASPCVHTAYWSTTACLQLFPAARRIRASYSSACRVHWRELGL
jgi:predicted choloylglycine hydrolase